MADEEIMKAILENAVVARDELKAAMSFSDVCIVIGLPATGQIVYCSSCSMPDFLKVLSNTVVQCYEKMKPTLPQPTTENPGSIN